MNGLGNITQSTYPGPEIYEGGNIHGPPTNDVDSVQVKHTQLSPLSPPSLLSSRTTTSTAQTRQITMRTHTPRLTPDLPQPLVLQLSDPPESHPQQTTTSPIVPTALSPLQGNQSRMKPPTSPPIQCHHPRNPILRT